MTTGLIVAIVVLVLILLGLALLLPRMRAKSQERKAEKELEARREQVATEHRGEAEARTSRADEAEQQAAIAAQAAQAERARAEQHEQQAQLHERGMADDELMSDSTGQRADSRHDTDGGRTEDHADRTSDATSSTDRPAQHSGTADADRDTTDYEQGREDERQSR